MIQEDNSFLGLLRVRLARGGILRLQGNQGCLVDMVTLRVGHLSPQDARTHTLARMLVHLRAMEVEISSTRPLPEYSLLIPKMKEKVEITGSKCEEVNLGNYLHHV